MLYPISDEQIKTIEEEIERSKTFDELFTIAKNILNIYKFHHIDIDMFDGYGDLNRKFIHDAYIIFPLVEAIQSILEYDTFIVGVNDFVFYQRIRDLADVANLFSKLEEKQKYLEENLQTKDNHRLSSNI